MYQTNSTAYRKYFFPMQRLPCLSIASSAVFYMVIQPLWFCITLKKFEKMILKLLWSVKVSLWVFLVDNGMSLLCLSLKTSSTEWHFVLLWRKSFSHVFVLGAGSLITVSYKSVKWEVNKNHWKPSPPWQRRTKSSSRLFIKATDYFFFLAYFKEYK